MRGRPVSAAKEVGHSDEAIHEGELVLTVSKRGRRVGTEPNRMRWGGMVPCTSTPRLQEGCPHRAAVLALATLLPALVAANDWKVGVVIAQGTPRVPVTPAREDLPVAVADKLTMLPLLPILLLLLRSLYQTPRSQGSRLAVTGEPQHPARWCSSPKSSPRSRRRTRRS